MRNNFLLSVYWWFSKFRFFICLMVVAIVLMPLAIEAYDQNMSKAEPQGTTKSFIAPTQPIAKAIYATSPAATDIIQCKITSKMLGMLFIAKAVQPQNIIIIRLYKAEKNVAVAQTSSAVVFGPQWTKKGNSYVLTECLFDDNQARKHLFTANHNFDNVV